MDPRRRRQVERTSLEIRRALGLELRRLRLDVGLSLRALGAAAEIDPAHIARIERGERTAGLETLVRLATWLGADLSVRLFPRTRPLLRDHLQAQMLEALLAIARPTLGRHLEVAVNRPGGAYIDLVLVDVAAGRLVAVEAQSQLRRIELTVRRHRDVADALGATEIARFAIGVDGRDPVVDRLLLLRSTRANRQAAREHRELMAAAYPASPAALRAEIGAMGRGPGAACCGSTSDATGPGCCDRSPGDPRSPGTRGRGSRRPGSLTVAWPTRPVPATRRRFGGGHVAGASLAARPRAPSEGIDRVRRPRTPA
jgi:transcriptional regulator with XRE-family HTH domain